MGVLRCCFGFHNRDGVDVAATLTDRRAIVAVLLVERTRRRLSGWRAGSLGQWQTPQTWIKWWVKHNET